MCLSNATCLCRYALGASAYTNTLLSQGITVRTLKEFTTGELAGTGFPLLFAKRVFKAARHLPDNSSADDDTGTSTGTGTGTGAGTGTGEVNNVNALYVDGSDGCLMSAAALDELDSLLAAESKKNMFAERLGAVGISKAGGGGGGAGVGGGTRGKSKRTDEDHFGGGDGGRGGGGRGVRRGTIPLKRSMTTSLSSPKSPGSGRSPGKAIHSHSFIRSTYV